MCTTCGCGQGETQIEGKELHTHEHPHTHDHHHDHEHDHSHDHHHHAHAPGVGASRMVQIEQDILSQNNEYAAQNAAYFAQHKILALNLLSAPGSGKTSLLERSIRDLSGEFEMAVIEGDQATTQDAERIRSTGVKAVQINTGKGCHLDAHMVGHALEDLQPEPNSLMFIENVGNLVCPAAFALGEAAKVVILSVTEGDDKPIKYPDMFHQADLLLLNKIDLLPYVDFDVERCVGFARKLKPGIRVLRVSARTGEGMADWYDWLRANQRLAALG